MSAGASGWPIASPQSQDSRTKSRRRADDCERQGRMCVCVCCGGGEGCATPRLRADAPLAAVARASGPVLHPPSVLSRRAGRQERTRARRAPAAAAACRRRRLPVPPLKARPPRGARVRWRPRAGGSRTAARPPRSRAANVHHGRRASRPQGGRGGPRRRRPPPRRAERWRHEAKGGGLGGGRNSWLRGWLRRRRARACVLAEVRAPRVATRSCDTLLPRSRYVRSLVGAQLEATTGALTDVAENAPPSCKTRPAPRTGIGPPTAAARAPCF